MPPIPKIVIASLITAAFATAPVTQAAKPSHAGGGGKPARMEQRAGQAHDKMERSQSREMDRAQRQERKTDETDRLQGLEKQRVKKAEQQQKELGRGSEQGQESRETHRRKWWRFWE